MSTESAGIDLTFDAAHVWHPYTGLDHRRPIFPVRSAEGVHITLEDGRKLIDGMASWWAAIHGYRHPRIVAAMQRQLEQMPHVMFGGLTHEPAVTLAQRLVSLLPDPLDAVFFSDSGSVAVEVAMKMAVQHWAVRDRPAKCRFAAFEGAYHGDTFGAMSVCDPVRGMHSLFAGALTEQLFLPRPATRLGTPAPPEALAALTAEIATHADELAAVIVEPLVQGAGGMWFYSEDYLKTLRAACDAHGVLLIFDEIATGFGRTGETFALDKAGVTPDLVCLGKGLTGGNLTLAATVASRDIAETLSTEGPGVFMHGPTYMANPLACAAANASLELLEDGSWRASIAALERALEAGLAPARELAGVTDVRVCGAIGVIELDRPVDMARAPQLFVDRGVWVRPFTNLIYVMPPYILGPDDTGHLTAAMCEVAEVLTDRP